ncbi:MAG: N-acetylglucosamine kinase [Bacteroidetes bacterium QH_7_62_13]|nr:MAG: N-acetylglucosamine kinase [Bacteroidetes bacterium QH_7_62_13]
MPSSSLFVGLDAGASKTRLIAERAGGDERLERRGSGANPNQVGRAEAAEVLAGLVGEVLREVSGVETMLLSAGVAGAGRAEMRRALAEALRAALREKGLARECGGPAVQVEVVHDALIALDAAYDTGGGLVVIAGTGSVVVGRTAEGNLLRAGGWGHVLGDAGSGYALGRAGLRAVAATFDGGAETVLRGRVRDSHGIGDRETLMRKVYQGAFGVQAVAPLVIEAAAEGDAVASALLSEHVSRLVEQIGWVLTRTEAMSSRITLLGGLLQNAHYEERLRSCLRERFPAWRVGRLEEEPAVGALRRAHRLRAE